MNRGHLESRGRGRPLVPLLLLLGGWVGARLLLAAAPETGGAAASHRIADRRPVPAAVPLPARAAPPAVSRSASAPRPVPPPAQGPAHLPLGLPPALPAAAPWIAPPAPPRPVPQPPASGAPVLPAALPAARPMPESPMLPLHGPPDRAGARLPNHPLRGARVRAHALHAALAYARYGAALLAAPPGRGMPSVLPADPAEPPRLSGSGWLFARRGDPVPAGAASGTGYGGSQGGLVLRWRISDEPAGRLPARASLVARVTGTPEGDAETAAGLAVRPLPALPATVVVEGRFGRAGGDAGAAYLLVAPPPRRLPGGFRLEAYGAGGAVFGNRRTGFHDAAVRIVRSLDAAGGRPVELSAAAWTGGQDGLHRVDVGPGIAVPVSIGGTAARLQLDWRQRIAGTAEPGSGPALTLAADF